MPGIATYFQILAQTVGRLMASGDPTLRTIGQTIQNNSAYAYMGAIGPSIADFIPSDPVPPGLPGGNPYQDIWKIVFAVVGGDGTPANPGLLSILNTMNSFLDRVDAIAAAENTAALQAMKGQISVINQTAAALGKLVTDIQRNRISPVMADIAVGMRPAVDVPVGSAAPPPEVWAVRDFLSWKRTGSFCKALLARATAEANGTRRNQFLAYAYGYLSSYVARVCGSPFVNSIVRAPYRTHWWRTRWVNNYVDAWTYGFYQTPGAEMIGDTPAPPYDKWADLCSAKLQQKLEGDDIGVLNPNDVMAALRQGTPLPQVLPVEFEQFWFAAFSDAYAPLSPHSRVKPGALNGAYVMTWMQLWFQTSGEVVGCNPAPPMMPPDGCGGAPPWVDPSSSVPGDTGGGTGPPAPSVDTKTDTGQEACGIILAILGGLGILAGGWAAGAAAIAGGITLILTSTIPDWAKLRCDLYWYRMYVYNGLKLLHELMTLAALTPPYVRELQHDSSEVLNTGLMYDSGKLVVKSRALREGFPGKPWDSTGLPADWIHAPNTFENPQTIAYLAEQYPSFFVADPANALVATVNDVRTGGPWPVRLDTKGLPVQFANAVDNSLDILANLAADLPTWNLDADRGLAYLNWQFHLGTYTDPVQIDREG